MCKQHVFVLAASGGPGLNYCVYRFTHKNTKKDVIWDDSRETFLLMSHISLTYIEVKS